MIVECPYCGSRNVECTGYEFQGFMCDDELGNDEDYICKESSCGKKFVLLATYVMRHAIFCDENGKELKEE